MSLRETILSAPDLKREREEVPEWQTPVGGPVVVWIGMMSGTERSAWSAEAFDDEGNLITKAMRARLLVRCLVDEGGTPIFTAADIEALEAKNGAVLIRLFNKAKKLNALTPAAVDDAEKN